MEIFQKLVGNKQHMGLNVFLCANNEYFYYDMWSKIQSNTAILHYFTWEYQQETYANFWIKAVSKIGNIYSEILCAICKSNFNHRCMGKENLGGGVKIFCPNVCSQQFRLPIILPPFNQGALGKCFPGKHFLKFSHPFLHSQPHIYYKIQLWRTQISPSPTNWPNTSVEIA